MGRIQFPLRFALMLLLVSCFACSKQSSEAPQAIAIEEVPATMESAFKEASEEVANEASEAVAAVQSSDDSEAFLKLQDLNGRDDLTPEQRQAAAAAWMAVQQRLAEEAAKGNQRAEETLQQYRSSK